MKIRRPHACASRSHGEPLGDPALRSNMQVTPLLRLASLAPRWRCSAFNHNAPHSRGTDRHRRAREEPGCVYAIVGVWSACSSVLPSPPAPSVVVGRGRAGRCGRRAPLRGPGAVEALERRLRGARRRVAAEPGLLRPPAPVWRPAIHAPRLRADVRCGRGLSRRRAAGVGRDRRPPPLHPLRRSPRLTCAPAPSRNTRPSRRTRRSGPRSTRVVPEHHRARPVPGRDADRAGHRRRPRRPLRGLVAAVLPIALAVVAVLITFGIVFSLSPRRPRCRSSSPPWCR